MSNQTDQKRDQASNEGMEGYNTPIEPTQRHTGMYEKDDGKDEAQPEGGSADTGLEGAPNQGLEKR